MMVGVIVLAGLLGAVLYARRGSSAGDQAPEFTAPPAIATLQQWLRHRSEIHTRAIEEQAHARQAFEHVWITDRLRQTPIESCAGRGLRLQPLRTAGIDTMADLKQHSADSLLALPGVGPKTAEAVLGELRQLEAELTRTVPHPEGVGSPEARQLMHATNVAATSGARQSRLVPLVEQVDRLAQVVGPPTSPAGTRRPRRTAGHSPPETFDPTVDTAVAALSRQAVAALEADDLDTLEQRCAELFSAAQEAGADYWPGPAGPGTPPLGKIGLAVVIAAIVGAAAIAAATLEPDPVELTTFVPSTDVAGRTPEIDLQQLAQSTRATTGATQTSTIEPPTTSAPTTAAPTTTTTPPTTTPPTTTPPTTRPPTTRAPTTTPPTTAAPTTAPPITAAPALAAAPAGCDPNYTPCVPIDSDVDCAGGSGNGPSYVRGPVQVIGRDIYGLDDDNDGIGCE